MEKTSMNMNTDDYSVGSFPTYSLTNMFDLSEERSFMELLGVQNMNNSYSFLDLPVDVKESITDNGGNGKESSLNSQQQQPATPNSSSISSASSEALNDEHNKTVDQANIHLQKQ